MENSSSIIISPFTPADQEEAKALILAGLEERWGWLDTTKNPDLNDIAGSYAGSVILTARQDGKIVGTGILSPDGDGTAMIVRMSVAKNLRRQGLGKNILMRLIEEARSAGIRRIVLETTETWEDAVAFYRGNGFRITHYLDGDVYFQMDL